MLNIERIKKELRAKRPNGIEHYTAENALRLLLSIRKPLCLSFEVTLGYNEQMNAYTCDVIYYNKVDNYYSMKSWKDAIMSAYEDILK